MTAEKEVPKSVTTGVLNLPLYFLAIRRILKLSDHNRYNTRRVEKV